MSTIPGISPEFPGERNNKTIGIPMVIHELLKKFGHGLPRLLDAYEHSCQISDLISCIPVQATLIFPKKLTEL
jgi:hypothetical protein